jgi:hypothetical protein
MPSVLPVFVGSGVIAQGQEEINALFVIAVLFRLDGKAERELHVMVSGAAVGAVGRQLVTAQCFGAPDGVFLQGGPDALVAEGRVHGEGVNLGLDQGLAVESQGRTTDFRTNRQHGELQQSGHLARLERYEAVARERLEKAALDELKLLRRGGGEAVQELGIAGVIVAPFFDLKIRVVLH